MSLHIEFDIFNGNIINCCSIASTKPQFNIISCCIGQVLCKPWRVVELTACTGGCTVLTIPEDITGLENYRSRIIPSRMKATLTEVIISNKWRDTIMTWCITRTVLIRKTGNQFWISSSKCPNMLSVASSSMSQTYTINIIAINSPSILPKGTSWPNLVSPYPPTHTAVW